MPHQDLQSLGEWVFNFLRDLMKNLFLSLAEVQDHKIHRVAAIHYSK